MEKKFAIRWIEINAKDQMVKKQKSFATKTAMDRFLDKVQGQDNFVRFDSYCGTERNW